MPSGGGPTLFAQLSKCRPDLKVLYLTGFADQLFVQRGTLWEGETFLGKRTVRTSRRGKASFTFTAPGVSAGQVVTATATDASRVKASTSQAWSTA